jgi:hypothetical protein
LKFQSLSTNFFRLSLLRFLKSGLPSHCSGASHSIILINSDIGSSHPQLPPLSGPLGPVGGVVSSGPSVSSPSLYESFTISFNCLRASVVCVSRSLIALFNSASGSSLYGKAFFPSYGSVSCFAGASHTIGFSGVHSSGASGVSCFVRFLITSSTFLSISSIVSFSPSSMFTSCFFFLGSFSASFKAFLRLF